MTQKLKASQFIEIDEEFLDMVSSKLFEKQQLSEYLTVEEVANRIKRSSQTVRAHLRNHSNGEAEKPCLKGFKIGNDWLISQENLKEYLTSKEK